MWCRPKHRCPKSRSVFGSLRSSGPNSHRTGVGSSMGHTCVRLHPRFTCSLMSYSAISVHPFKRRKSYPLFFKLSASFCLVMCVCGFAICVLVHAVSWRLPRFLAAQWVTCVCFWGLICVCFPVVASFRVIWQSFSEFYGSKIILRPFNFL